MTNVISLRSTIQTIIIATTYKLLTTLPLSLITIQERPYLVHTVGPAERECVLFPGSKVIQIGYSYVSGESVYVAVQPAIGKGSCTKGEKVEGQIDIVEIHEKK